MGLFQDCGSSSNTTPGSSGSVPIPAPTTNLTQQTVLINIQQDADEIPNSGGLSSADIIIGPGTQVTWTNQDSTAHEITANSGLWDSGVLEPGASFSFTFTTIGTFDYYFKDYPNVNGKISVDSLSTSTN